MLLSGCGGQSSEDDPQQLLNIITKCPHGGTVSLTGYKNGWHIPIVGDYTNVGIETKCEWIKTKDDNSTETEDELGDKNENS